MASATLKQQLKIGSLTIDRTIARTSDHENTYEVALAAAKAVTSWVKTDADTAACVLPGSHGYVTGTYDVYWTGGKRTGVAGTVTINALALEGGAGTDFPASANTTVTVCVQTVIAIAIDGDNCKVFGVSLEYDDLTLTSVGYLDLLATGAVSIEAFSLTANAPVILDFAGGVSNVLTGNVIVSATASHSDATNAATLKILSLEDAT